MANSSISKALTVRTWGTVLLLFGLFVLTMADNDIPERANLTEVTGLLRSLENNTSKGGGLSAVRFSVSTDARHFSYHSSAGHIDEVWEALNHAGEAEVGVLIDSTNSHSPPGDDRSLYTVLEIRIGNQTIRPYAQVVKSLEDNTFIGKALGYGTAAIGFFLLVAGFIRRR